MRTFLRRKVMTLLHFAGVLTATLMGFGTVSAAADSTYTPQAEAGLLSALTALKDHVHGEQRLDAQGIEVQKRVTDQPWELFGYDSTIIEASFDLVAAYDQINGPLWIAHEAFDRGKGGTEKTPPNDIHWTVYSVMQNIMDRVYATANVARFPDLLNGFKFGSSSHFLGPVTVAADPRVVHRVKINASCPKPFKHQLMHQEVPARRPTGVYLVLGRSVRRIGALSIVGAQGQCGLPHGCCQLVGPAAQGYRIPDRTRPRPAVAELQRADRRADQEDSAGYLQSILPERAPARESHPWVDAQGRLCLWYDRPAETWMTESLPIGNGPLGAMLFGGTGIERVQFNEISLWSGTRMAVEGLDDEGQDLGAYQAFGDILIHLTVNKPAAYTGRVQLADMHQAQITAAGKKLSSVGKLQNGFEYEAQLLVLNKNGALVVKNDDGCAKNPWGVVVLATSLAFERCDSVTLILGAGHELPPSSHQAVTGRASPRRRHEASGCRGQAERGEAAGAA
jgi:hypothetical protein